MAELGSAIADLTWIVKVLWVSLSSTMRSMRGRQTEARSAITARASENQEAP